MSKQIRKTRYEKNLRVGVRFDGSNFVLLDGTALPKLVTGAVGELVLRPEAIEDPIARARFIQDDLLPILSKGARVFVGVSPHLIGKPNLDGLLRDPQQMGLQTEYWLVEVRLEQDLRIRIRGDQEARLEKCKCVIPALKKEASSVNHAFTIVSEAYETLRLSHTGNVFERAYARIEPTGWQSLDQLRLTAIAGLLASSRSKRAG